MGKGLARKAWGQKIKRPEYSPEIPTPANADKVVSPSTSPQAAQKAGMSAEQARGLLEKTSTPQVKNQLRETTEAACKYGVSNSRCVAPALKAESENLCWVPTRPSPPQLSQMTLILSLPVPGRDGKRGRQMVRKDRAPES